MVTQVQDESSRRVLGIAVECCAKCFGVAVEDIHGKSRKHLIAYARHAYCALIVFEYNTRPSKIRLSDIGGYIGKDHTSVIHSTDVFHSNSMAAKNSEYITVYYKTRKMFLESIGKMSNVEVRKRISEIHLMEVKLELEKKELLSMKDKKT